MKNDEGRSKNGWQQKLISFAGQTFHNHKDESSYLSGPGRDDD
jgi:hypothetical protein